MSTYPHDLDAFRKAYEATTFTPIAHKTLEEDWHCGCPQGVLARHLAGPFPDAGDLFDSTEPWVDKVLGLKPGQFTAFAVGFDSGILGEYKVCGQGWGASDPAHIYDAFKMGVACRKEFLGLD